MSIQRIGPPLAGIWRSLCPRVAWMVLVLQAACITPVGVQRGDGYSYDNSVSAACRQNPANCPALAGKEAAFEPVRQAGTAGLSVAVVLAALNDEARSSIEQALTHCVELARSEILLRYQTAFKGPSPDANECNQWTVDAQGRRVTWAMRLGTEMHEVARQCAEEALNKLRPGGFSLEQRYRYDRQTGQKKPISTEEERALVESGNQGELKGTLKPDVVIHSGSLLDVQAIYDFKFPCVNTDVAPHWTKYPEGHPYSGYDQGAMYEMAFGSNVARIIPRLGVVR
ncbi:hypothetical protein [Archangium lansingense]|uniref:Lipoprotein n=1 Tax=Archangium lansingense TaxID=2995310 RepID=A0ABT4A4A5_9BACT|nr:hypothetical protein [Archangium lansinium]MCY1076485.1 hypothetical protein [Archangium lansinium]